MRERHGGCHRGGAVRALALPASLLLFGLVSACGEDVRGGVEGEWTAAQEERGDTLVVRTIGGSVWGDTATLVPELAIGEIEGDDPYLFGRISGIDVDGAGRVFVVDQQARQVRVFSSDGAHQHSFGRSGEGPGEFTNPDHVRVLADRRIVVRDQPSRFSVFSYEGEYLGGWPLAAGFATGTPFFLGADGGILNPTFQDRLVLYGLDGEARDTVPVPSGGFSPPTLEVTMEGGMARYSIPYMPTESWTVDDAGTVFFGVGSEYRIERRARNEVLRIEREVDPIPVQPGEAAAARERITSMIQGAINPGWRWDGPDIPGTKPVFLSMIPGRDGSVWVLRPSRGVEEENPAWDPEAPDETSRTVWSERVVADVFDAQGRFLGPVKLPPEMRALLPLPVVTADEVWAAARGEHGIEQVVRFRVEVGEDGS